MCMWVRLQPHVAVHRNLNVHILITNLVLQVIERLCSAFGEDILEANPNPYYLNPKVNFNTNPNDTRKQNSNHLILPA